MPSVAVPEVSNDTVISEPETIELVAVNVIEEPAFSAMLDELAAKEIVGAASLSIIVIVEDVKVVAHSLVSELFGIKLRITVSLISEIESSVGVSEKVCEIPDIVKSGIVSKSVPSVADPPVVIEYVVPVTGPSNVIVKSIVSDEFSLIDVAV